MCLEKSRKKVIQGYCTEQDPVVRSLGSVVATLKVDDREIMGTNTYLAKSVSIWI